MNNLPLKSGHALEAPQAPITAFRHCRIDTDKFIERPYLARATLAPSAEHPDGSARHAEKFSQYSVLQQHCLYWDRDGDGVIWPLDTFRGCRDLGFNLLFSFLAMIVIHATMSLPTRISCGYLPDPLWRIHVETIHAAKHGSDSGIFDNEGRFLPCKFEDMWTKHGQRNPKGTPRTKMDIFELLLFLQANRVAMDPFGWVAGFLEWIVTVMLVQVEGAVEKEDVRRVLDGSLFFEIQAARQTPEGWNKGFGLGGDGFIGGEKLLPFGL